MKRKGIEAQHSLATEGCFVPLRKAICFYAFALFSIFLSSCGTRSGHFNIEGHLLNINQGQFLLYSPDKVINGIDTIRLNGGRFSHDIECDRKGLLMLVFPNFSEIPIFAEPGKSVTINGDASHLKELEIKGTETNEKMNALRKQLAKAMPNEEHSIATKFIEENPESMVSIYLLRRFFLLSDKPDYKEAQRLFDLIKKKQESTSVTRVETALEKAKASGVGQKSVSFKATGINGRTISEDDIRGKLAVIYTWASWSYESMEMQRQLRRIARQNNGRLALIGISLDASRKDCDKALKRDSITAPTVCDELMFNSPVVNKLGLIGVPDNVIIDKNGRILQHGLNTDKLKEHLNKLLR